MDSRRRLGLSCNGMAPGDMRWEARRIETTGSGLSPPGNFASAEPFVYNGKLYVAYQLNEPSAPGSTNAEIWFTSVFDESATAPREYGALRFRMRLPGTFRMG